MIFIFYISLFLTFLMCSFMVKAEVFSKTSVYYENARRGYLKPVLFLMAATFSISFFTSIQWWVAILLIFLATVLSGFFGVHLARHQDHIENLNPMPKGGQISEWIDWNEKNKNKKL